jgi:DNA-binding NarL/FixJ family response regulator
MEQITVLLADDHLIVRQGLRVLLELDGDIRVVGECENGRQALRMARELAPDVVVMDISMPMLNGLDATRQIVKEVPATKVIMLSCHNDSDRVQQATQAGALGYLLKEDAATELIKAVREVKRGNAFLCPAISKRLIERYRESLLQGANRKDRSDVLTSRESEVLQLVAEGKSNKQMAAELCLSIKTVERHRQQMMDKLDIHDIASLTRFAISRGMIECNVRLRVQPE